MKRRALLLISFMLLAVCIFVITASAEETYSPAKDTTFNIGGIEYPVWEEDENGVLHPLMWYKNGDKLSSVRADNMDSTKKPYVSYSVWSDSTHVQIGNITITDAEGNTFNGKSTVVIANLSRIYPRKDGRGITIIHKDAFRGSTVLKAVYIPETFKGIGWGNNDNIVSFQNCSALQYVEFPARTNMTTLGSNSFENCTSLKAISIPEGVTSITHTSFSGCTALEAIYLPSTLESFSDHNWNTGAFYNCSKAYFVAEPFKLNSTLTNVPSKPTVYYFPKNLTLIDETLRNMANVNDVLVFGDQMLTYDANSFTGTGAKGTTKTVVFTGAMTYFKMGDAIDHSINFIFTNLTDESVINARTDRGYNDTYAYLCKTGRKAKLGWGVKWEDGTTHFAEPKSTKSVSATCETNRFDTTYCFCGTKIDDNKEIANTSLGHDYSVLSSISYKDYAKEGTKVHSCSRHNCESTSESSVAAIIAKFSGYSVPTNPQKAGITFRYEINRDALEEYNSINEELKFGVVAVVEMLANGNKPLTNDCQINSEIAANVIFADISESNTKVVDFVILGSAAQWESTQEINGVETNLKDLAIIMAGYIYDGAGVHYIQSKGTMTDLEAVSYSQVNSAQ